jgi:hypothetical protein
MSEADTTAPDNAPPQDGESAPTPPPPEPKAEAEAPKPESKTFDEAYVKQLRSEAAKARVEAKNAADELEKLRRAAMSEQERAIVEARDEGRRQALGEIGVRLVDAEIRAVAAGRFTDGQMSVLMQGLNRQAFLADDGSVDVKSVQTFVDGLAPKQDTSPPGFPDMGQGPRSTNTALNGDPLLRDLKAKLGIA